MSVEILEHLQSPEWGRLPKPQGRLEGLSRTTCTEIIDNGLVKSVTIRQPGAQRGIRLIWLPGLRKYLHELADKQAREKTVLKDGKRRSPSHPQKAG